MPRNCSHPCCGDECRREKKQKKITKIKKVSDKRSKLDKLYSSMRTVFLKHNPACKVCGGRAEQIHHKRGRLGGNYLDMTTWIAVCHPCHSWVHDNDKEAREMGYLESRLKKQ